MYPSISIIIPSWNQGKFIERTLLSILKQEYSGKVQIIVSDGGSKDETVDILKKYDSKITWWSAPDKGFVDAVMKGATVATGDLLAIQSSDDYYLPNTFLNICEGFNIHPDASFISGWEVYIDTESKILFTQKHTGDITPKSALQFFTPQHCTFVKREFFEKVNGLRSEVDMCADLDLWYRISHLAKGYYIDKYIGVYQLHPEQRTKISTKWYDSLVNMVETCESNAQYGSLFKLKPEEKKNLYTYWKIGWTAKYDKDKARQYADDVIDHINEYDNRTKDMIYTFSTARQNDYSAPYYTKVLSALKNGTVWNKILKKIGYAKRNDQHLNQLDDLIPLINWWAK